MSFASVYRTYTKIQGHKTNVKKFKGVEIIKSVFSNNNGIKLKINNRKPPNPWRLNNTFLNTAWIKEK